MIMTVLGRHGPWPAAGGACSSYLLEAGGVLLLVDCGCGALGKLQAHCGIEELDGIVLTHLHSDHMGDIPVLRYALPYFTSRGLLRGSLPVFLPAEPAEIVQPIITDANIDVRTVTGGDSFAFKGLELSFFSTRHPLQCNAVRVAHGGKAFVFSGDMNTTPGFERFARHADLLLIDGCFPASEWNEGLPHLSAVLAAGVAAEAQVRRAVLTHMRPLCDEAALLAEARQAFPAAEIARDGGRYEL